MKSRILMFHRVLPKALIHKENPYFQRGTLISIQKLEEVIQLLYTQGYRFETIKNFDNNNENIALLTFDDGYFDCYKYALPILEKYNIKASFYPTLGYCLNQSLSPLDYYYHYVVSKVAIAQQTDWITGKRKKAFLKLKTPAQKKFINHLFSNCKELFSTVKNNSYMTINQLKILQNLGHEIGGHSMYHDIYPNLTVSEVRDDLARMMKIFDENGINISSFAYTDGKYSNLIINELKAININKACAIQSKKYAEDENMEIEREFVTMNWKWN